MQPNKSVEEIKGLVEKYASFYYNDFVYPNDQKEEKINAYREENMKWCLDEIYKLSTSHTNTVLQRVVERVEKLQKEYANDLQENGVVSIKKLYLEEEKRADCQGSYLSLETVLSLLNDQIISNEE